MDNQVRLLPAVIGAAAVLVVLRLAAMAAGEAGALSTSGVAAAAESTDATPAATAAASAQAPANAAAPATTPGIAASSIGTPTGAPTPITPPTAPAADAGPQNKGEADVLHGLSDRRAELEARENELALREQLLMATQKQVDEKIAQLKELQSKLDTMLAQRDDAQKAQLNALVKMYENMKAPDAAKIFNELDRRILVEVAGGMKPAKVGAILAAMDAAKAQQLTALLATRLLLPEPQHVETPTPVTPVDASSPAMIPNGPAAPSALTPSALDATTPVPAATPTPASPQAAAPTPPAPPAG